MEYLLDTHSFLWFVYGDSQLSGKARDVIASRDEARYVSTVSFWEIAIKTAIGKLKLAMSFQELGQQLDFYGFKILPITFEHTFELSFLELHHRDPFDRILIAQALLDHLTIVSKDMNFSKYKDLQVVW
jgi:PIN domain nuclease of toxin-antitoxin system